MSRNSFYFFENVSIFGVHLEEMDDFIKYVIQQNIDNTFNWSFVRDEELYKVKINNRKATEHDIYDLINKLDHFYNTNIEEDDIVNIVDVEDYEEEDEEEVGIDAQYIEELFVTLINGIFKDKIVTIELFDDEKYFVIYKGESPKEVFSFSSYKQLTK